MYRSSDFRPCFAHIYELRAHVPPGTPVLAATATVTKQMREDVIKRLDMEGCKYVCKSPNKPNIMYYVLRQSTIENDLSHILDDLRKNSICANRVIVYCRSLNVCSALYAHFLFELKEKSYYPIGSQEISDNRIFGMYHSNTPPHNKEVILSSMCKVDGIVRVVFATSALGMGVDFAGLNTTIHYGAPRTVDEYFQESGRAGRNEQQLATSTIYWSPSDVPNRKDMSKSQNVEMAVMRRYLKNDTVCRRYFLLSYFDESLARSLPSRDPLSCCDNCKNVHSDSS